MQLRAGINPISAKLFCKNSQVAFMPYGAGLKDERPTSNIQRPIKNKYPIPNIQRLFEFLFSSFDTRNILINSSVSCNMVAYSGIWELFNNLYDSHRLLEQPF
jgi:hypothetical protein